MSRFFHRSNKSRLNESMPNLISRGTSNRRRLAAESLETRRVLSGVTQDGSDLTVLGTPGDDIITAEVVSIEGERQLKITINGGSTFYPNNQVSHVNVYGDFLPEGEEASVEELGGNDTITIDATVRQTTLLLGQGGDDAISAGSGATEAGGGAGDDEIAGSPEGDVLRGGGGDDVIRGGDGNDQIHGGVGNDRLGGGDGNDSIEGDPFDLETDPEPNPEAIPEPNPEASVQAAGDGARIEPQPVDDPGPPAFNDIIRGGAGNDRLAGRLGNDLIFGGAGNDAANGGSGHDGIDAGDGDDWVLGGLGNDVIFGGAGDDHIHGLAGHDALVGGGGHDLVTGDAGNDCLATRPTLTRRATRIRGSTLEISPTPIAGMTP